MCFSSSQHDFYFHRFPPFDIIMGCGYKTHVIQGCKHYCHDFDLQFIIFPLHHAFRWFAFILCSHWWENNEKSCICASMSSDKLDRRRTTFNIYRARHLIEGVLFLRPFSISRSKQTETEEIDFNHFPCFCFSRFVFHFSAFLCHCSPAVGEQKAWKTSPALSSPNRTRNKFRFNLN